MSDKIIADLVASYKSNESEAIRREAANQLLELAQNNNAALYRILEFLPFKPMELRRDIITSLSGFVPQIAEILNGQHNALWWCDHTDVCKVLAELGERAGAAVPALVRHTELYPRFELNVWALGKIGGTEAVRNLNRWTWFQGASHDRKRTDAACDSLSSLGQLGINELLKLADSGDELERTRALLNLFEYTECSREALKPLLLRGIDRSSSPQLVDALEERL